MFQRPLVKKPTADELGKACDKFIMQVEEIFREKYKQLSINQQPPDANTGISGNIQSAVNLSGYANSLLISMMAFGRIFPLYEVHNIKHEALTDVYLNSANDLKHIIELAEEYGVEKEKIIAVTEMLDAFIAPAQDAVEKLAAETSTYARKC